MITVLQYLVVIFGYLAPLVFIFGMAYRIWKRGRLPRGFDWGLFPQPTKWIVTNFILGRILALPILFKSGKDVLILALLMHFAIVGSIALHFELFTALGAENIIHIIGSSAGITGSVLVAYFVLRRFVVTETRELSAFSDYFWLSFLLIQVSLGAYMRVGNVVEPEVYRAFAISIITLNPTLPLPNPWFLIHSLLGLIYLMYIQSGKMMHSIEWLFGQYILVSEKR